MKVLVTGALGLTGRAIIDACPPDVEIEVLLDPATRQLPGYAWYRSDITLYDRTEMAVTCSDPDWVIHCAEIGDPDICERDPERAFRVNADGAENVARAADVAGARMLMISSEYVFDGMTGPFGEDDRPNPQTAFGRSKLMGEQAAAERNNLLTILRLSHRFGRRSEWGGQTFFTALADRLGAGDQFPVPIDQYTTPTYLGEMVEVLWMLVSEGRTGIYHYGTADRLSLADMAERVCAAFGYDESLLTPVKTADMRSAATRPLQGGFITDTIHDLLGRPPLTCNTALMRMTERGELP